MAPIVLRAAKARKSSRDYPGAMLLTVAIADIDKLAPGQGYSRLGSSRPSGRRYHGILGAPSSHMSEVKQASGGYPALLSDGGFQSFLWTQFLGAFNDNVYKMIVSVAAVEIAASQQVGARYLSLAGAVFVIPFLLFAGYAGQLADRFSKTRVLQVTKAFEILFMITGLVALVERSMGLLLTVLFLLAVQANFFSPAKYGILPETLAEAQLTRA